MKRRKNQKKKRTIEVKKVAEEWEIWDKEEEVAKSKEKAKKLVSQRFHKLIYVFGKKVSERMPTKKLWNHVIKIKEEFVLRKEKVYLSSRKKRREVQEFIKEQLRKRYIRLAKSSQMALIFFVEKKNSKKKIV